MTKEEIDLLAKGFAPIVRQYVQQEIAKATNGLLKYSGVWRPDRAYLADTMVSHGGSAWVSTKETIAGERPGQGATGWTLAVKREVAK